MSTQQFSPVRSRTSRKPWPDCPDINIYRCKNCGRLYQSLGREAEPPQACCGNMLERVQAVSPDTAAPAVRLSYEIVGGFNQNAVQIFWECEKPEDRPEWIMLKTYTGSYIKYLNEDKRAPLVFPLSDEDAYVYCDRPVCQKCVFKCKNGFIAFIYIESKGQLVEMPLDKASDYFKTKA